MRINPGIAAALALVLVVAAGAAGYLLAPWIQERLGTEQLAVGEVYDGELTSEAPRNFNDGSHFHRIAVDLPRDQLVQFELDATFPGELALYSPEEKLVASTMAEEQTGLGNDRSPGRLSYRPRTAGTYLLVVSSGGSGEDGPFNIESRLRDLSGNDTVQPGSTVEGWLDGETSTHTLVIEESGLYTVDMASPEFDTILELSGQGMSLTDDDGGQNRNSRIQTMLEPGEYELGARSYNHEGSGFYSLSVAQEEMPEDRELQNGGALELGTSVNGLLQGNQVEYTLQVPERALYTFDLSSETFDTVLEVEGNNRLLSNDDYGPGTNSRLEALLEAGEFTVRVSSFSSGGNGMFTLQANGEPLGDDFALRNDGRVTPSDRIRGMLPPSESNGYTLAIDDAGSYTIDLRSTAFDAYLELSGEGVSLADDDGGTGLNSRLRTQLQPGEYRLQIRDAFRSAGGLYDLEIR